MANQMIKNTSNFKWVLQSSLNLLKKKLSVFCMGLGAKGADFVELDVLTWKAKLSGAKGVFNHAGLSATKLGEGFSSISSTMTLMQTELPSETVKEDQDEREVVKLKNRESLAKSMDDCRFIRSDVV
jgi:hypothetical protein